jgi:capsular exopolysaccharide synthesis family protein
MDYGGFLRAIRRWRWMIGLVTLTAAITSGLVTLQAPKVYITQAVGLVSPKQLLPAGAGVNTNDPSQVPSIDQLVETYVGLINSYPVRQRMIAEGIPRSDFQLGAEIAAVRQPNTTLISIRVTDLDPAVSLAAARAVIPAFNSSLADLQAKVGAKQSAVLDSLVPWEIPVPGSTFPLAPDIFKSMLLAGGAALVLTIGLAMLLERVDNTVKQEGDVGLKLGVPLLGSVVRRPATEQDGASETELVSERHVNDPVAEQYRALRTNVLYAREAEKLKTLLVTSTRPGEGKTTTACNLAISLAHAGHRVVLMDADFRRPALHRIFSRTTNIGLGNLILQDRPETELIVATDVRNLRLICSGPTPPNPSELLGSAGMKRVLASVLRSADIVIIDSPPVGAVTDATVLGAMVDGVIVVVERGGTQVRAIQKTMHTLQSVGVRVLGVVLNKTRASDMAEYYAYYYSGTTAATGGKATRRPRRMKPVPDAKSN